MKVINVVNKGNDEDVRKYVKNKDSMLSIGRNVSSFHVLLDEKRKNLPGIDASVEKCLMLTRLVTFAREVRNFLFHSKYIGLVSFF